MTNKAITNKVKQGNVDVTRREYAEQMEAADRLYHRVGLAFTLLCAAIGFFAWPAIVYWGTGDNVIDTLFESGNPWYIAIVMGTFALTGLFTGTIGMVVYRRKG
jgi:hypothetical protein